MLTRSLPRTALHRAVSPNLNLMGRSAGWRLPGQAVQLPPATLYGRYARLSSQTSPTEDPPSTTSPSEDGPGIYDQPTPYPFPWKTDARMLQPWRTKVFPLPTGFWSGFLNSLRSQVFSMIRIATITNFIGRQGHSPSDMGRGAEVALRAVCKAISENDQAALKNMLTPALYSVYQPPLERLNRENGRVVLELGSVDLGQIVESDTFVAPSDAMKRYWYEYLIRWGYRRPVSEDDLAQMRETYLTKLANKTKEIRDQDTRNHTVTLVPSETGVTYVPFNPSSAKKSLLSAKAMESILERAKQLERIIQVDVLLDADVRFEVQLPTGATGIAECDEPVESQLHRFVIVTLQATCSTTHDQSPLDWRVADIDYTVDRQVVMNRLTHPDVIPLAESYPARQPS